MGRGKEYIIAEEPKDSTFQIRVNAEVKKELEKIYGKAGLSLTEAINVFFQQSINVCGLPFLVNRDDEQVRRLMAYFITLGESATKDNV